MSPPVQITAADVMAAQVRVCQHWLSHLNAPYEWGRVDCSHLMVTLGHVAAGTWPITGGESETYRCAADIWTMPELVTLERWEDREPGDIVCFGELGANGRPTSPCHHVVGVLPGNQLIGANSGGPPLPGEPVSAYITRQAVAGARVKIVGADYWASHRLGVRRVPRLNLPMQGPPLPPLPPSTNAA